MRNVVWSAEAESDLYDILAYWVYRNKSSLFSIKLEAEIREGISAITLNPEIGKKIEGDNARLKLIRDYWIVYDITEHQIEILSIFDTRQDDKKLKKKIKKEQ